MTVATQGPVATPPEVAQVARVPVKVAPSLLIETEVTGMEEVQVAHVPALKCVMFNSPTDHSSSPEHMLCQTHHKLWTLLENLCCHLVDT